MRPSRATIPATWRSAMKASTATIPGRTERARLRVASTRRPRAAANKTNATAERGTVHRSWMRIPAWRASAEPGALPARNRRSSRRPQNLGVRSAEDLALAEGEHEALDPEGARGFAGPGRQLEHVHAAQLPACAIERDGVVCFDLSDEPPAVAFEHDDVRQDSRLVVRPRRSGGGRDPGSTKTHPGESSSPPARPDRGRSSVPEPRTEIPS